MKRLQLMVAVLAIALIQGACGSDDSKHSKTLPKGNVRSYAQLSFAYDATATSMKPVAISFGLTGPDLAEAYTLLPPDVKLDVLPGEFGITSMSVTFAHDVTLPVINPLKFTLRAGQDLQISIGFAGVDTNATGVVYLDLFHDDPDQDGVHGASDCAPYNPRIPNIDPCP